MMEANVVVVGSGAAGLMAAVEAADQGATVIVLESEPMTGGSTRLSGAYVALCETPLQPGTREELYEDLVHSHHNDCQEDLSRLYVDEAAATHRKLEDVGVRFVRAFRFAHMSRPWAHELSGDEMSGGAEIVTRLEAAARARGVRIETDARVRRLLIEAGRVTGVNFERDDETHRCMATRGVVLATGGFTRSRELIRNFGRPGSESILPLTGQGSRGDGLLMGMSAGAGISYMTVGVAPTAPSDPETGKGAMVLYAGAIALNREGRRFCRESDLYIDTCWALLSQPDAVCVQVYDSRMKASYAQTMMGKVLTGFREFEAPTLEVLARQLAAEGFDACGIVAGVERYNVQLAGSGDTDFGRAHAVGDSGVLLPIAEAPFHAVICRAGTTHFNGGLTVDTSMNVQNVYGDPIAGLYAAGEVTGGFHGAGYMSGTFVGMALIFGRVAGRSAAA
ncbi:FAD-dependent oxidoreductase [Aquamicrobium sp. LC103]|nr:FAD-dependent oxidoreductase [Aquamicrobium sp. LC103]